jgi:hypothetical protein
VVDWRRIPENIRSYYLNALWAVTNETIPRDGPYTSSLCTARGLPLPHKHFKEHFPQLRFVSDTKVIVIVSVARVPIPIEGGDRIRGNVGKDYRTMNIGGECAIYDPAASCVPQAPGALNGDVVAWWRNIFRVGACVVGPPPSLHLLYRKHNLRWNHSWGGLGILVFWQDF